MSAPESSEPGGTMRAVIDIGTNSVKLLAARVHDRNVEPLFETSHVTRLGRGFYETHLLQPDAIRQTAQTVAEFTTKARSLGVAAPRVIATSAARDALNPQDLLNAVRVAAGLEVEVISGAQEAQWAFDGVTSDGRLAGHPLLIMDVGGGSTEFIVGEGREQFFRDSFQLGVVRLIEKLRPADPPTAVDLAACRAEIRAFLRQRVAPNVDPALTRAGRERVVLVGVGGSATYLAAIQLALTDFSRDHIEALRLTRAQVHDWTERLWRVALAERQKIPGLPAKRADVMITGAAIYEAVMEQFGFNELRVSTRGLRFAALMDPP